MIIVAVVACVVIAVCFLTSPKSEKAANETETEDKTEETTLAEEADTTAETEAAEIAVTDTTAEAFPETDASSPAPAPAETQAAVHTHSYQSRVVAPTCTQQGYTVYTCSCGDSYTGSFIDPVHDASKGYLCAKCGKALLKYGDLGLAVWIEQNGTETPKGTEKYISFNHAGSTYSIYSQVDESRAYYYDSFEYINGDARITISSNNGSIECGIYYDTGDAHIVGYVKKSALTPTGAVTLDNCEFYAGKNQQATQEALLAQLNEKLPIIMRVIRDNMLTPQVGLTLDSLGFTSFGG